MTQRNTLNFSFLEKKKDSHAQYKQHGHHSHGHPDNQGKNNDKPSHKRKHSDEAYSHRKKSKVSSSSKSHSDKGKHRKDDKQSSHSYKHQISSLKGHHHHRNNRDYKETHKPLYRRDKPKAQASITLTSKLSIILSSANSGNPKGLKFRFDNFTNTEEKYSNLFKSILTSSSYQILRQAIKSKNYENADLANLIKQKVGSVNLESKGEYYSFENDQVKHAAFTFLENFWSDRKNRYLVDDEQYNKFKLKNIKAPGCISFVSTIMDQKNYCFVAISDPINNKKVVQAIEAVCTQLNEKQQNITFLSCPVSSKNYGYLLANIVDHLETTNNEYKWNKFCAEKSFCSTLAKIFIEKPNALIQGIINIRLYPYKDEDLDLYGKSHEFRYILPPKNEKLITSNNYILDNIPCCESCKVNFPAVLAILAAIKEVNLSPTAQNKITLFSPLPGTFYSALQPLNTPSASQSNASDFKLQSASEGSTVTHSTFPTPMLTDTSFIPPLNSALDATSMSPLISFSLLGCTKEQNSDMMQTSESTIQHPMTLKNST